MPGRKVVLATGEVYHLINRGNDRRPIFLGKRDHQRFLNTIVYYQYFLPSIKLSYFLVLSKEKRDQFIEKLSQNNKYLVEIICYCLMPNHFHFLVKQTEEGGISKFMSQIQNSYTRYFNVKNKRVGSLFQGQFKAKRIETDEQLIHLSRYIHLNPYTSFVVKTLQDLTNYPWSSFPEYIGKNKISFLKKNLVFDLFNNAFDYQEFVFNQADYQRELEIIKHLTWEDV